MKNAALFCFFVGLFFGQAQQRQIDSLTRLLTGHTEQDTLRLQMLNDLTYLYYSYDADKGIVTADEAITLAKKLNDPIRLAGAYQYKGHNYLTKGLDTLAMDLYDKALKIYREKRDSTKLARVIFNKGRVYFGRSEYGNSIKHSLMAYQIFERKKDSMLMAKMLNSIGINYMYQSDFTNSLKQYLAALAIYDRLGKTDDSEYASTLSNVGLLYYRLENLPQALAYQQKALVKYEGLDSQLGIANALTNLGNVYDEMNDPKKAMELYGESYKKMETMGNKTGMANALTNMGIAAFSLNEYGKTIENMNRTKNVYQELGDANNLSIAYSYIGKSYMKLAEKSLDRNSLTKAKNNLELSLKNAEKANSLLNQGLALDDLAKVNTRLNDYRAAYDAMEKAIAIKDSIYSSERKEEIVRMEEKYEYDKREAENKLENEKNRALAQAEIERQKTIRNGSILGGGGLVLATLLGLVLYKRKRDAISQKAEAEFNSKVADTELRALRSQMNPHFIFNSLNSINAFIAKNDKDTASDYLVKFAKLMRRTLENSEKKEIPIKDDLELLTTYLDIESKRLAHKFTFEIRVDKAIDTENTLVPPLILQPFMENSIWHGISPKNGTGHITVDVRKKGDMIMYAIDDDGVGIKKSTDKEKTEQHESLGMKLTKSRIDIINKRKNSRGVVRLIEKEEGVRVEVELPLEMAF